MSIVKYLIFFAFSFISTLPTAYAATSTNNPKSHFATVNNVRLHYLEMGTGPLVILLHGWPETSLSWIKTMKALSNHYRVVAPDLRGLGLSEKTQHGYDKKTIATDIKALIQHLNEKQAVVIGHDMGGKVAYMMAHLYPEVVSKLVLVDCFIPGTENTDALRGGSWHHGFHMAPDMPEMLTQGREKEYIRAQIKAWSFKKDAICESTIEEYAKHYSSKGGMTAGFNYYRTLKEDAAFAKTFRGQTLSMPVLAITGDHSLGNKLSKSLVSEAPSLKSIIIGDTGHFVAEESPKIFNSAILKFLKE